VTPHRRHADWLSAAEARDAILHAAAPLAAETRPLMASLGHVLAADVASPVDLPPWDNSAMDGFATRAQDVRGATRDDPRVLRVTGDVAAGHFADAPLGPGEAIRIMTGAPVPAGADGVVRVEHTDGGTEMGTPGARVSVYSDEDAGRNVRPRGEDVRAGDVVLRAGTVLRAAHLAVAASVGAASLAVVRRPIVAVLASGDELVDLEGFAEVAAGRRIVSSNSYALAAMLAEAGMEARVLGIAADTPASLRAHLARAAGCDAVVTTAGVSVGEHDHVLATLREMETEVAFWRVRARPGSAMAFGRIGALGGIPWFGLPGNPVSTQVCFEAFVRPALLRMAGHANVFAPTVTATVRDGFRAKAGLTHFLRVRLTREPDGAVLAWLTGSQGSGVATSMAAADGLLVVPEDHEGAAPGDVLPAIVLGGAPAQGSPGW
jgi:molybdopterin molybdotransferase